VEQDVPAAGWALGEPSPVGAGHCDWCRAESLGLWELVDPIRGSSFVDRPCALAVVDRPEDRGRLITQSRVPALWESGWTPGDRFVRRRFQGLSALMVQLEGTSQLVIVIEAGPGLELARGRAPNPAAARELAYFISPSSSPCSSRMAGWSTTSRRSTTGSARERSGG
jgi:hypothetical protein